MRSILFIILFLITKLTFGHINPLLLSNGNLIYNQDLKSNYRIDYTFLGTNNVTLDDIGIEFFNVGDDDTSQLFIEIYEKESKKLIVKSDTIIREIYNQTVFLNTNIQLFPNVTYQFIIGSRDKNNDDRIHLFNTLVLPYTSFEFPVKTLELFSDNKQFPLTTTTKCPFLSFGIGSQIGIDFIAGKNLYKYPADIKAHEFSTVFSLVNEPITLTKIGLYYLDVGKDSLANLRFFIKENNTNKTLFSKDTLIKNVFKKKFDINCNVDLSNSIFYTVGFQNLNLEDTSNILLAYRTDSLPYRDNLNLISISNYQKNNLTDTLGIAYYFAYRLKSLETFDQKLDDFEIKKINDQTTIYFNEKLNNSNLNIYDINGCFIYSDKIINEKVILDEKFLSRNQIYIIENHTYHFIIKIYYS